MAKIVFFCRSDGGEDGLRETAPRTTREIWIQINQRNAILEKPMVNTVLLVLAIVLLLLISCLFPEEERPSCSIPLWMLLRWNRLLVSLFGVTAAARSRPLASMIPVASFERLVTWLSEFGVTTTLRGPLKRIFSKLGVCAGCGALFVTVNILKPPKLRNPNQGGVAISKERSFPVTSETTSTAEVELAPVLNTKPEAAPMKLKSRDDKSPKQLNKVAPAVEKKPGARSSHPTPSCPRRSIASGSPSQLVLKPGELLLDDRGLPVHAHGGGIMVPRQAGATHERYFWYGESAKNNSLAAVNAYSSMDLVNWRFEGVMLDAVDVARALWADHAAALSFEQSAAQDLMAGLARRAVEVDHLKESLGSPLRKQRGLGKAAVGLAEHLKNDTFSQSLDAPRIVIERPKVVFCPTTKLYVMYFHLDHYRHDETPHYHWRCAAVATSRLPVGPFVLARVLRPDNYPSLDLTLHQLHESDGVALAGEVFLVRSLDNRFLAVSRLRPDFMDTVGGDLDDGDDDVSDFGGADMTTRRNPRSQTDGPLEAPGVFMSGGRVFMLASHLRGWLHSPLELLKLSNPSLASFSSFTLLPDGPSASDTVSSVTSTLSPGSNEFHGGDNVETNFEKPTSGSIGSGLIPGSGGFVELERPSLSKSGHYSQCAFVVPYCTSDGQPYHVYIGDRWNVQWHQGRPRPSGDASYVMLPIVVNSTGSILLPWRETWNPEDPFPLGPDAYHRWQEGPAPPSRGGWKGRSKFMWQKKKREELQAVLDVEETAKKRRGILDDDWSADKKKVGAPVIRPIDPETRFGISLPEVSPLLTSSERDVDSSRTVSSTTVLEDLPVLVVAATYVSPTETAYLKSPPSEFGQLPPTTQVEAQTSLVALEPAMSRLRSAVNVTKFIPVDVSGLMQLKKRPSPEPYESPRAQNYSTRAPLR